ncbi:MAG TPA: glycerol-3-phosphate dehydrogenase/oxidase [Thermomicrobiales bacterium]|nr:glycerol-3-phosphate dehydrogenase/oxidase [Thermomicrobiales bacterium]
MSGADAPTRYHRSRSTPIPPEIGSTTYDLAVIGAGINGCGIARDAAMRGLQVLLVDKGDIGAQTTAWSTRLIHGGLRYLERFELSLVRESLRERLTLLTIAPHLVKPMQFLAPIYRGSRRGPMAMRAGMLAYDALSFGKRLPRHRMLSREEALACEPGLNARELLGASLYYDAQVTFPERLALENALSAREHGCDVVTYLRVESIQATPNQGITLAMRDELEGVTLRVTASAVVNATGPWVDEIAGKLGSERLVGGTKGSHVVVAPFPGAPGRAVYAEAATDRRPFFVIPWNGMYLIGTTDVRHQGDPALATASTDETDYLIAQAVAMFPRSGLAASSVLYTYSGVRPLRLSRRGPESAITRRHSVVRHEPPFSTALSIVGGKLTTYRELAEQATDRVFDVLRRPDPGPSTASTPLPGASVNTAPASNGGDAEAIDPDVEGRLRGIYGTRSEAVAGFAASRANMRVFPGTALLQMEPAFGIEHELAQTLEDVLMRRAMVGLSAKNGASVTAQALEALSVHAGWSSERCNAEREDFERYLSRFAAPRSAGLER